MTKILRFIASLGLVITVFNISNYANARVKGNMLTELPVYFSCGGSVHKSTDLLGESCFPQVD